MWTLAVDALAQASVEEAPVDDVVEIVIVEGDLRVARTRAELEAEILALGYRPGKSRGDRVVFRPEVPWHPSLVLYDDGRLALRRSPVRFGLPEGTPEYTYLFCVLRPDLCVHAGGQVIAPRKLDTAKSEVLVGTRDEMTAWTEAMVDRNLTGRRDQDVPAALDALWTAGVALDGGPDLATVVERRRAMLAFWASRTCTDAGDEIAEVAAAYLRHVVQAGPDAATPEEIAAASAACRCERTLEPSDG